MSMTLIAHQELTSTQASISFASIPQTFTDLVVVFSGRSNRAAVFDNIRIMPNGATTGVNSRILFGSGSSAQSFTEGYITGYTNGSTSVASSFGNSSIYIPNYRSSVAKSLSMDSVSGNNVTSVATAISAGGWTGTVAITSIILDQGDGTDWLTGTSATLYGITAGSSGGVVVS